MDPTHTDAHEPRRRPVIGIRSRVVVWYLVLFAVLLGVGVLTLERLLVARLDTDIGQVLAQEIQELRLLAAGTDPDTGAPFGTDPRPLFETFLSRNVPGTGEAFFTLVGGAPFASSVDPPYDLFLDDAVVGAWSDVGAGTYGEAVTPEGPVRWLAVSVGGEQDPQGVFAVAQFYGPDRAEIRDTSRVLALIAAGILVLATALGWLAAGRAIAPITRLERAARRAGADDLSERIPERGNDEVARLTRTFNDLLERLQTAFVGQRQFLDDVGHDLRTPITILRGNLELLPEDPVERTAVLDMCLDELSRMERYVSDLTLLARSEQPDFLRPAPVALGRLTQGMLERGRSLAEEREWVIEHQADDVVMLDEDRITQAWLNIVANAVQHTQQGDLIRLGSDASAEEIELWVADPGPGVPAADRMRVFDRRARLGATRERRPEGSGLGLAIVQAIAEAHGGRAVIGESEAGGARVSLALPRVPPPNAGGRVGQPGSAATPRLS